MYLYLYLNRCICICFCIWIKLEQNICICIWKIQIFVFVFVFVFDKTYLTPALQSALPFWDTAISKFDHENPWSRSCVWSKVKVMFDLQNSKVKVMVKVKPIGESICLLFVSWQLDHFWLRYRKFHIWPWKFKVNVMAKVRPDGHIWALEFNRYVRFSFRGNRTTFGGDIANSIFDLENSRSRSWPRSNPMVTFEP